MTIAAHQALLEGQSITHSVGRVTVVLTCIREGASYRAGVCHASTAGRLGAEIAELSQSWPTEVEARAAARRIVRAFTSRPADQPFAVVVEQALASIAAQFDEAIRAALGGGDGCGTIQRPLASLTKAREALRTPAERIAENELLERLRADLERYDVDERYRAACSQAAVDLPACEPEGAGEPAQSWAQIRDRHAAAVERDRAA